MENEQLVLGLLESVLGKGKPDKNKKDHVFHCPICNHKKPKLVVNVSSGQYNCWTCHPPTKGKTPVSLFKKLGVDKARIVPPHRLHAARGQGPFNCNHAFLVGAGQFF